MGTRTVRLDDDAEALLASLQKQTGLSISNVLKRGLETLATVASKENTVKPYEVYRHLDLGAGGEAVAPATEAKDRVVEIIKKKHNR